MAAWEKELLTEGASAEAAPAAEAEEAKPSDLPPVVWEVQQPPITMGTHF